jgi:serine/threonine protein kinase
MPSSDRQDLPAPTVELPLRPRRGPPEVDATQLVPAAHDSEPPPTLPSLLPVTAPEAVSEADGPEPVELAPLELGEGSDALAALAAAFAPRFELRERLGRGGMGTVFAATQPGTTRVFALKVLHGGRNAKDYARFEREMNLTAQIDHPNVIRVFDYGRLPQGTVYYAMELIRGKSLAQLLAEDPGLPLRRIARIMLHAARGLGAAHAVGVVHRDVKPENLMVADVLGWPDFTRILDFGIARTLGTSAARAVTLTSGGIFLGTPRYAAPEVILAGPLTPAADIYSFGCVLYVLLSGKGPFDHAGTPLGILEAHVTEPPRSLASVARQPVPEPLVQLVDACLAKAPEARPQRLDAVVDVLVAVLDGLDDAPDTDLDAAGPRVIRRRTPSLEVAVMQPPGLSDGPSSGVRSRPPTPALGEVPAVSQPEGPPATRRKPSSRPLDAAGEFRAVPQRLMTPVPPRTPPRVTPAAPAPSAIAPVSAPPHGAEPSVRVTRRERLYLVVIAASLLTIALLLALR